MNISKNVCNARLSMHRCIGDVKVVYETTRIWINTIVASEIDMGNLIMFGAIEPESGSYLSSGKY